VRLKQWVTFLFAVEFFSCYHYRPPLLVQPTGKSPLVQIRLSVPKEKVKISTNKGGKISFNFRTYWEWNPGEEVKIFPTRTGFQMDVGKKIVSDLQDTVLFISQERIRMANREYRGIIKVFFSADSGLTVVNCLPVDEYLYSVVPCEIGPINTATYQAVKAQAVAARSFALARIGKRRGLGYDLYDTYLRDQEYWGAVAERDLAIKAVNETKGEVLVYQGKIAMTLYHGNCGGITADGSLGYLPGIYDTPNHQRGATSFCAEGGNFNWQLTIAIDSLEKTFTQVLSMASRLRIRRIQLEKDQKSRRVRRLHLETNQGKFTVSGQDCRFALGLKSTMFDLQIVGRKAVFTGRGWGHGVGLCQEGAIEMAKRGYNYREILAHYYPVLRFRRRY